MNLDRLLLSVAAMILRVTDAAWRKIASGGVDFGDLRARLRFLEGELARKDEVIELLQSRLGRFDPDRRPHYSRHSRFAILWHIRRWGLSITQAARTFVLAPTTISRWFAAVERRRSALVGPPSPLNRLPDLTRELVRRLLLEQAAWAPAGSATPWFAWA